MLRKVRNGLGLLAMLVLIGVAVCIPLAAHRLTPKCSVTANVSGDQPFAPQLPARVCHGANTSK